MLTPLQCACAIVLPYDPCSWPSSSSMIIFELIGQSASRNALESCPPDSDNSGAATSENLIELSSESLIVSPSITLLIWIHSIALHHLSTGVVLVVKLALLTLLQLLHLRLSEL